MSFPVPRRFVDASGEAVGYKHAVAFPLRVAPRDQAMPCRLRLAMFFAVCKEICIPASDRAELGSWQSDPAQGQLLASFEGRVPARAGPSSPLRVIAAHPDVAGGKLGLRLTLAGRLPEDLDIFVESKDTSYFHAPQFEGGNTCVLALAGAADPLRLAGAALKLTMVGRNLALEQDIVVA